MKPLHEEVRRVQAEFGGSFEGIRHWLVQEQKLEVTKDWKVDEAQVTIAMNLLNHRREENSAAWRLWDLQMYFDSVEHFDWFHEMSDDNRVYEAGNAAWQKLIQTQYGDQAKKDILKAWQDYHYSGKNWSKPQAPKPVRPS